MKLMRMVAAAGVLTGAAVGGTGTAVADAVPEGVYNLILDGAQVATWNISPICVPTVGDARVPIEDPVGCGLAVLSTAADTGTFRLAGGQWTYASFVQGAMKCDDGTSASVHRTYAFDSESMTGTQTVTYGHACGLQPSIIRHPLSLTFV